jgi:hypothetical protein
VGVVRGLSLLAALGLIAWSCVDDGLLGGATGFGWTQLGLLCVGIALAASCLAPIAWNARGLALVASTAFALGAAELALRLFLAPRYHPPFRLHERYLYELVPGARREHRRAEVNGGERILYEVNRDGYRGDELDASGGGIRIALYGDSFIQGEFSALEHTFAERLERRLSERLGRRTEVVNAGVGGYGPDQELRRLEDELPRLRPTLVIVALFAGNDFGDLARNKLYRLTDDGELRENAFVIDPELRRRFEISRSELIVKRIAREARDALLGSGRTDAAEWSLPPRQRMDRYLEQGEREYREYAVEGDDVVHDFTRDVYNADVSLRPSSESARYKVLLMDRIVARMQRAAAALPVPLVLLLIPHPIDACGHDVAEVDRSKYPEYEPSGPTRLLAGIARRHGIPHVDLFDAFHGPSCRELFFRGPDDHWNDRGQDVAAEVVAEALMAGGLLRVASE